jgi:hypothetical protein
MTPALAIVTAWRVLAGKNASPYVAPDPTPSDSPFKVWDGAAWVTASAPPTS